MARKIQQFLSMKQVAEQTGIPVEHIKIIKVLYPEGFGKNQMWPDKIAKYYEDHKAEIVDKQSKSYDELKKVKLSGEIVLQDIEIEEAKKKVVAIKDVEEFMQSFGIQLSAVLKSKIVKELPPRVVGLKEEAVDTICKTFYNELCDLLNRNIIEWNKTK